MEQKPSIGRVVHYQSFGSPGGEYPSLPRAAIITDVPPQGGLEDSVSATTVGLCVLSPTGIFFNHANYDADGKPGTWRWPPRV